MVESTLMPGTLSFALDTNAGTCPARTYIYYIIHGADADTQRRNAEATYALLLTAKATGQVVRIGGYNNGCTAETIYFGSVDRY